MHVTKYLLIALLMTSALSGCQSNSQEMEDKIAPEEFYKQGLESLKENDYKQATEYFSKVFYRNPGHEVTSKSEIMHAYSLYKQAEYDEALDIIDIFLKLHPRHEHADYMYYLRGLCYYVQISDIQLDQASSEKALLSFNELIKTYPDSKYSVDSHVKIKSILDHKAGHEIAIGRYYLNKKNPIAAIKRFQTVISDYSSTKHMPEALYRLVEANMFLGLKVEAIKYHKVLEGDYPKSDWFGYSKELIE